MNIKNHNSQVIRSGRRFRFNLLLAVVLSPVILWALSGVAHAAPQCTNLPNFNIVPGGGGGLVTTIVTEIDNILMEVARDMYNGIISAGSFQATVQAAAILYIAIYGIMFTVGMVQATVSDVAIRTIKLSIVGILISPTSWGFFTNTVITFFNDGTDDLINALTAIAVGGIAVPGGAPFSVLDTAMTKALSAKMIVTLLAVFTTGPNGVIIGLLLLASLGSFIRTVFKAMMVYIMSLVMKTLLFGIAPLFIACLLFTRTKHLFNGWLNQVLNASLQPIMLFAFFAFFVALISATIDNVMTTPVCWTQLADGLRGSRFGQHFWRFQVDDGSGNPTTFRGLWHFTGAIRDAGAPAGPVFPIDIVVVIVFILLAELSARFNKIVLDVAKDISGAATNLSALAGSMTHWFNQTAGNTGRGGGGGGGGGGGLSGALGSGGAARSFIDQMGGAIGRR